jgi:hypothetical protein
MRNRTANGIRIKAAHKKVIEMKKRICVLMMILITLTLWADNTNDTVYVSTIGGFFFSKSPVKGEYYFYKISSKSDLDTFNILYDSLFDVTRFVNTREKLPLLRHLNIIDFNLQLAYVLISPPGDSCEIGQPYYLKGSKSLYFTKSIYKNRGEGQYPNEIKRFYRIYSVNKKNDTFNKFMKEDKSYIPIEFKTYLDAKK